MSALLQKFPRNESCEQCGTRRWYLENGFRFCKNGHRVEGFIEFDVDGEDDFGPTGKVSRKAKEKRVNLSKHLEGKQAHELCVECLQLILRRQVAFLMHTKGVSRELEGVVRALWDLRLRNVKSLRSTALDEDASQRDGARECSRAKCHAESEADSDGEEVMFSSQIDSMRAAPENSISDESGPNSAQAWGHDRKMWVGEEFDLPRLQDTLALCYIGCLLVGEPIRIGDLHQWAMADQVPLFGSFNILPKEWRERLPIFFQRVLRSKSPLSEGGHLHRLVGNLTSGFAKNFGMAFPPLNWAPVLLHYLWDLALPPTVFKLVEDIIRTLDLGFSFPSKRPRGRLGRISSDPTKHRWRILDNPDAMLVGCVVLATKAAYPFDEVTRYPKKSTDPIVLKMDWVKWRTIMSQKRIKETQRPNFDLIDPIKMISLDEEKFDDYLRFFHERYVTESSAENEVDRLFPLSPPLSGHTLSSGARSSMKADEERDIEIIGDMSSVKPQGDDRGEDRLRRIGAQHQIYRSTSDLSGSAEAFYNVVADVSGLSLHDLVQAVYHLEKSWEWWMVREKRAQEGSEMTGKFGAGRKSL